MKDNQKQKLALKKDDTDPLLGATTRDDDVSTAVVLEPELVTATAVEVGTPTKRYT